MGCLEAVVSSSRAEPHAGGLRMTLCLQLVGDGVKEVQVGLKPLVPGTRAAARPDLDIRHRLTCARHSGLHCPRVDGRVWKKRQPFGHPTESTEVVLGGERAHWKRVDRWLPLCPFVVPTPQAVTLPSR